MQAHPVWDQGRNEKGTSLDNPRTVFIFNASKKPTINKIKKLNTFFTKLSRKGGLER
jgi:hypothetical protein